MFTGLIEAVGVVKSVVPGAGGLTMTLDLGRIVEGCQVGDSIAINGVCLTIAKLNGDLATFALSEETVKKTSLSRLKPLSQVNVERAIKSNDRFGGHFVSGHIDGTAIIRTIKRYGEFADMTFTADSEILDNMILKGSVAVDGISLTIADIDNNSFTVALIPETLKRTTLGKAKIGDQVNIETDIIIKAIKKQMEKILPRQQQLTIDRLKQLGF